MNTTCVYRLIKKQRKSTRAISGSLLFCSFTLRPSLLILPICIFPLKSQPRKQTLIIKYLYSSYVCRAINSYFWASYITYNVRTRNISHVFCTEMSHIPSCWLRLSPYHTSSWKLDTNWLTCSSAARRHWRRASTWPSPNEHSLCKIKERNTLHRQADGTCY